MHLESITTDAIKDEFKNNGIGGVAESAWRTALRRTVVGSCIGTVFDDLLVEKLAKFPRLGYWPQIREPRSFNEKIMHRKYFTDDERFSTVSDKWAVRDYVADRVGSDVLTKVYHVTDDPRTIPFNSLPPEYVIKPTHTSGGVSIVDEGEEPDETEIIETYEDWLDRTFGVEQGEYWYGDIEPQVLIEERLRGKESVVPRDFKFFVFHGQVEYIDVHYDRYGNHTRRLYDTEWNPQEFELTFPLGPVTSEPEHLDKMIDIAETLGDDFDFMRVDLYQTGSKGVKFGELTVAPGEGGSPFRPKEYDFELGSLW